MRVHVTASYISKGVDLRGKVVDSSDEKEHGISLDEMETMIERGKAREATESEKTSYPEKRTRSRVAPVEVPKKTGGKGGKQSKEEELSENPEESEEPTE